jgi:hypothetical protein
MTSRGSGTDKTKAAGLDKVSWFYYTREGREGLEGRMEWGMECGGTLITDRRGLRLGCIQKERNRKCIFLREAGAGAELPLRLGDKIFIFIFGAEKAMGG